jgi:hypothetical protein
MDLHIIALVFLVVQMANAKLPFSSGVTILTAAAVLTSAYIFIFYYYKGHTQRREEYVHVVRELGNSKNPVLSENPWIPILNNERPYMLDPFMFRLISQKNPSIARDLWIKLHEHFFSAVILQTDPETVEGKQAFDDVHFGEGFVSNLLQYYTLAGRYGDFLVYRPKT